MPARGHARAGERLAGSAYGHALGRGLSRLSGPLRQRRPDRRLRRRPQDRRQVLLHRGSQGIQFRTPAHALHRRVERHRRHPGPKRSAHHVCRFGADERLPAGVHATKRPAGAGGARRAADLARAPLQRLRALRYLRQCGVRGGRSPALYPVSPGGHRRALRGSPRQHHGGTTREPRGLGAARTTRSTRCSARSASRRCAQNFSPGTESISRSFGGIRSSPPPPSTASSITGGTPLRAVRMHPIRACC